jgi:hypothetical protein
MNRDRPSLFEMLGHSAADMAEAEKLVDMFDRVRGFIRQSGVHCVVTTPPAQADLTCTEWSIQFEAGTDPIVADGLAGTIAATTAMRCSNVTRLDGIPRYDFVSLIGYSHLRDGVCIDTRKEAELKQRTETIKGFDIDYERIPGDTPIDLGDSRWRSASGLNYFSHAHVGRFDASGPIPTIDNPGGGSPCWGDPAPTAERAAAERRRSKIHVNGRPKKGWQR